MDDLAPGNHWRLNPAASVGFFLHVNGDDDEVDKGASRWDNLAPEKH